MPEIAPLAEVIEEVGLGSTLTDAHESLLVQIKNRVEDNARRYCKHGITRAEYTVYLPNRQVFTPEAREYIDLQGDKVVIGNATHDGDILQLPQAYVVNDGTLAVYEDYDAEGGQGASDFPASTLLTKGTDYRLDTDDTGELSETGHLIRIVGSWSARSRTIKVTFNAGFTAAQLDSTYRDIKGAIIEETVVRFKMAQARGSDLPGAGPLRSFSIGGQVSYTFDTSVLPTSWALMANTKDALRPYRRIAL